MNLLAHSYLSFENEALILGNFLGDYVKGKDYKIYPEAIQKGILLHRHIDHTTDQHPIARKTKRFFTDKFRHYSAVLVDMYYDHILAKKWDNYCKKSLSEHAQNVYKVLKNGADTTPFPEAALRVLHYMSKHNWLFHYQYEAGITRALQGISRRSSHAPRLDHSYAIYRLHESEIEDQFQLFFKDIREAASSFISVS